MIEDDLEVSVDRQRLADWTRRLNLRHLQLLISLAEIGSLSDTARATSTSQPALSKWLKELEDSIGWALFERLPRGLKPTHHGEVLISYAHRVLNEMSRAQSSLAALHDASSQRVIVGTTPPTAAGLMPDAINDFLSLHPKAKIDLWESSMGILLEKLEQGAIDIVVGGMDNYQPNAQLCSEILYRESTQIIARSKHPLGRRRKALDWDDLYEYDWVVWPVGTSIRSKLDLALTRAGRGPLPYRVESSSLTANFALIESTDMLGAVSGRLSQYFVRRGAILTLPFTVDADSTVGIFWRAAGVQDAAATDMLASIKRVARREAG